MADKRYYHIHYSCGCGYNEEFVECKDQDEADALAYEMALEEYDSFAGLRGIPGVGDIAEDMYGKDVDELTEEEMTEVYDEYHQSREDWIDYGACQISETKYLIGIGELEDEFEDDDEDEEDW